MTPATIPLYPGLCNFEDSNEKFLQEHILRCSGPFNNVGTLGLSKEQATALDSHGRSEKQQSGQTSRRSVQSSPKTKGSNLVVKNRNASSVGSSTASTSAGTSHSIITTNKFDTEDFAKLRSTSSVENILMENIQFRLYLKTKTVKFAKLRYQPGD
eukprot:GHVP01008993.1.p1 GENE.GHVP01008993.1~~GHVP01008993.1.p1  ORF type:complete len:156 (-),score=22.03 GHVP01008993.1:142-609(-)